ncbi:MAG TPA: site-specific integrase [Blastocatellia bacterium]|nr:site-specific integrase [Blastocatellia bacterium]
MRLYKRDEIWWLDVTIDGQRYRMSLDTSDKRAARGRANERISEIEQGKFTKTGQNFAKLAFGEAAKRYLEGRRLELAPATLVNEQQLLVKLKEFFQASPVARISAEDILAYREWRASQKVGPGIINLEVGVLRRMLKRAKRWHLVADDIKPLKQPRSIGRALTPEQKLKLLEVASQRPEWETAYWAAMLALNTTMRSCEIKGLRWADIDFSARILTIHKSKTAAGERVIPLTLEALSVLSALHKRAKLFGGVEPEHYVFAALKTSGRFDRNRMCINQFDPTRPIRTWKRAWHRLTEKAGLAGLRFHDLRHHAITELAESGASDQTIMSIAGHVSRKMLDRYSHIRIEAKRNALEALSNRMPGGYGTIHGTMGQSVPTFTDLRSTGAIDGGAKKLEVAIVPE